MKELRSREVLWVLRSCASAPTLVCLTSLRYGPERYLYKEGLKLAAKYEEEEKALAEELKVGQGERRWGKGRRVEDGSWAQGYLGARGQAWGWLK